MPTLASTQSIATSAAGAKSASFFGANIPNPGEMLTAWAFYTDGTSGGGTLVDNQAGGTYTRVLSGTFGAANEHSFGFWVRDALVSVFTAHQLTWTPDGSDTGGGWVGHRWTGFTEAGSACAAQINTNRTNTAAATPAATMSSAFDTINAGVGIVFNLAAGVASLTAPTGWTEQHDSGYGTPNIGFEDVTRNSGETGSTITWGSASATAFAVGVVELQAFAPSLKTGKGVIG